MKNKILTTVSVIALMSTLPALSLIHIARAQIPATAAKNNSDIISKNTREAVKDMKSDTAKAYEETKAMLIGKQETDKNTPVVINSRKTANGIIGHHVYNEKHESVAKVTDIILSKDGKAEMVVVSESLLGMGTKAAFDYSAITRVEDDGDVIMPLTKEILDNAASFSYDKAEGKSGEKVRVIPDNGYSVAKLLDGKLLNQKKEPVADIENISFKDGKANQIIVGFDKMLGMGGEKAALSYSDAAIIRDGEKLNFQLSTKKTAQFEAYKKTLTK